MDFMDFTFGKYRSADLGITRVSGGDRFEEELSPEIKDRNVEVPGLDGEYYFGSDYGPKEINIEIAFDSMTEKQFRDLRRVFNTKKTQPLIFDERPYKQYMAKLESPIELSYVCFDEPKRKKGAERNGVRRDREKDSEDIKSISVSDTIIVPPQSELHFSLTHAPKDEVTINPEEVEYSYEAETYTYTFSNEGEEPITITLSYSYDEVTFVPAWEQVTPWDYEEGTQRIYKGEGKITFTCYFPFARSVYKVLPQTEEESDWAISSGILKESEYEGYDIYDNETGIINIYNGGDLPTGFRLYIPEAALDSQIGLAYTPFDQSVSDDPIEPLSLVIDSVTLKKIGEDEKVIRSEIDETTGEEVETVETIEAPKDMGILVDTINQLIVGVSEFEIDENGNATYKTSGNLYNEFISSGYFFKLEPGELTDGAKLAITNGAEGIQIFYDYLYF